MSSSRLTSVLLIYAVAHASTAWGSVKLPAVLTDHMVIQRDVPVHVWGTADSGEEVSVTFRGATRGDKADTLGRWSVYLPAGAAGGPFELIVKGANTVTLRDVLVGDVWIASGQSNMEWSLSGTANGAAEIDKANFSRIRLFTVKHSTSEHPLDDVEAQPWAACTPESAREFSAVAYYFGRDLHERLGIPIGLIESNWGGTPAEAWTSLDALSA